MSDARTNASGDFWAEWVSLDPGVSLYGRIQHGTITADGADNITAIRKAHEQLTATWNAWEYANQGTLTIAATHLHRLPPDPATGGERWAFVLTYVFQASRGR